MRIERDELLALISYDAATGGFTWLKDRTGKAVAGSPAGSVRGRYMRIRVKGRVYPAHWIAWLIAYGVWPSDQIDHINGDGKDNRIANLRACTEAENKQNMTIRRNNTVGIPGVSYQKHCGKFVAQISINKKRVRLAYCDTAEEAGEAYAKAKRELHTFAPTTRGFE